MTHTASHIIIQALKTPLSSKGGKVKIYHLVLAACLVCFISGALLF